MVSSLLSRERDRDRDREEAFSRIVSATQGVVGSQKGIEQNVPGILSLIFLSGVT